MEELEKRSIKVIELISLVFGIASCIFAAFSREAIDKYTDTGLRILFIFSFITSAVLVVCFFITLVTGARGLSSITLAAIGIYMILSILLADNSLVGNYDILDFLSPIVMIITCIMYILYVNKFDGMRIPVSVIMVLCSIMALLASIIGFLNPVYICYFIAVLLSTIGSFMAYEKTYEL